MFCVIAMVFEPPTDCFTGIILQFPGIFKQFTKCLTIKEWGYIFI